MPDLIRGKGDPLPKDLLSRFYHIGCFGALVLFIIAQVLLKCDVLSSQSSAAYTYPFASWARDVNTFTAGAFTVSCGLQVVRLVISVGNGSSPWDNRASLMASLVETFIATFSAWSMMIGGWGGVATDALGIRTCADIWAEYLVSVPLLAFILVSVSIEQWYTFEDFLIIGLNTLIVVFGSLMQTTKYLPLFRAYLSMAVLSYLAAGYYIMSSMMRLRIIVNAPVAVTDDNGLQKYLKLIASRRLSLSFCMILSFTAFPALWFLRANELIDDSILAAGFEISSAVAKIMFTSLCTDAHMEVSHPAIAQLSEEQKSHAARRAFLRYVFHEIRVPLNSISMGVQLLGDSDIDPDSPEGEVVLMIREATTFMGETLNDVLAIQKIEEGALKLIFKPFMIEDLLMISIEPFVELAAAKQITIKKKVQEKIPMYVVGDKYRLKHVVSNVISNAIKFGKHNTPVSIEVSCSKSYVTTVGEGENAKRVTLRDYSIAVTDSGKGVPVEELDNIFVPFLSTTPGELKQGRGTGVGLAICKEIVTRHGGNISCVSELGKGSTFTVVLPLEVVMEDDVGSLSKRMTSLFGEKAAALTEAFNPNSATGKHAEIISGSLHSDAGAYDAVKASGGAGASAVAAMSSFEAMTTSPAAAPMGGEGTDVSTQSPAPVPAQTQLPKSKAFYNFEVLVVDDVSSNRKLLTLLLKKKGLEPKMAEDGLQALDIVKAQKMDFFDCIFMDNTMPRMTGIECTKALRRHGYGNMIIGLTGNSMEEELVDFASKGADLVLTKPLKPAALDLLLAYFDENGVKSQKDQGLFMDSEKLMWVPKRRRSVSGSRDRGTSAHMRMREKPLVVESDLLGGESSGGSSKKDQ